MHSWDDDRIFQRACLGLAAAGHDVHLVVTRPEVVPDSEGVTFHWITPRSGFKRRWFSSKEAVKKAISIRADVYHFHDPDLLPHIDNIKLALPSSKVVYDIHENYTARFMAWGLPSFVGTAFRWYERRVISRIDGFSVVSDAMRVLFEGVNTPSVIIRNTADVNRLSSLDFSAVMPFEVPTIYTSGTNSHSRHCLQSVQALRYLIADSVDFCMMFAGKYLDGIDAELRAAAREGGTIDKLILEGMLPWEQNFLRTARAFCGCVFYADNANNRVGIPNRLFEYMFCGIPVVVSDFPELRNIVEKVGCGVIVNSESPESIAEGFRFLLSDHSRAKEMGARGKRAMETEYGYHVDLKATIEFYHSL